LAVPHWAKAAVVEQYARLPAPSYVVSTHTDAKDDKASSVFTPAACDRSSRGRYSVSRRLARRRSPQRPVILDADQVEDDSGLTAYDEQVCKG
jgi:hypothetical protein